MSTSPTDMGADLGVDSGPACACTSGACCDGCNIRPVGYGCGATPVGDPVCNGLANSMAVYTVIGRRCDGTADGCVADPATSEYMLDCTDYMCPGPNCGNGCTTQNPDCTGYADGCYASAALRTAGVCGDTTWIDEW